MAKSISKKTALSTLGYKIDFENETIWVTKEFGRLASIPQNKEFKKLTQLRRNYGYKVAYRKMDSRPRNTYENLTVKQMETNIHKFLLNDAEALSEALKDFSSLKKQYDGKQGGYGKIKKWYLDNFKKDHKKTFSRM